MSPSTDKRSDPAELLGPVSGHMQRAVGIEVERAPGDFPQVAVWVGEVTRVTAPEGVSRRLDDLASGGRREREYLVHLMPLAHIMRQRYAGEPRARTVPARAHVRSQLMKRVERQRRPLRSGRRRCRLLASWWSGIRARRGRTGATRRGLRRRG